jgi:hypothetical protein
LWDGFWGLALSCSLSNFLDIDIDIYHLLYMS